MFATLAMPDDGAELHWLKVCINPTFIYLFCLWFDAFVSVNHLFGLGLDSII
jgi:hypothetical protein